MLLIYKGRIMGSVITSILVLVIFGGWIYIQQPSMIFYPMSDVGETPENWGLQYEDVTMKTEDGIQLHAWFIPSTDSDRVLLFLHGNAGNISHRRESVSIFHKLGLSILIIDYRGYGKSEGKPSEAGLYIDARTAWHFLTGEKGIEKEKIMIFGRSLGGVVAANLAAEVQPGYLFLESTFSSAKKMAKEVFPIMSRIVPLRFKLETVEYIRNVKSPLLIAHSPDDEIIPYELGEEVFQAANEPKFFIKLTGGHNGGFLMTQPRYEQEIRKFLSFPENMQ